MQPGVIHTPCCITIIITSSSRLCSTHIYYVRFKYIRNKIPNDKMFHDRVLAGRLSYYGGSTSYSETFL